jgi:hypothetical protein
MQAQMVTNHGHNLTQFATEWLRATPKRGRPALGFLRSPIRFSTLAVIGSRRLATVAD